MIRTLRTAAIGGLSALLISGTGWAQTPEGKITTLVDDNGALAGKFEIDTAVPQSAGFSLIGLTPTAVVDPAASRITFASLANYLDENNNLKPGFALGGSPFWWFSDMSLDEYRDPAKKMLRIWARTEMSLGFADGGADKPDRVGFGFATELLGNSDYRLDDALYDCSRAAISASFGELKARRRTITEEASQKAQAEWNAAGGDHSKLPKLPPHIDPGDGAPENIWVGARAGQLIDEALSQANSAARAADKGAFAKALGDCRSDAEKRFANRQSLQIAGGIAARLVDGEPGKTKGDGGSLWASYRRPFRIAGVGAPNYIALFARHDFHKTKDLTGGGKQNYSKSTVALIAGYEAGRSKLSLQGGYESIDYRSFGPNRDDDYGFYTLAYDYRIADNTWLAVKAGSRGDQQSVTEKKDEYLLVNVRWAPGAK